MRTLAAWEVGLEPEDLSGSDTPRVGVSGAPAPATEAALRRLISRWCDGATRKDAAAMAACITLDGVFDMGKPVTGRDDVEKMFAKAFTSVLWAVQLAPNALFEIDEVAGTGTGRVTIHETLQHKKAEPITVLGVYHDRYQRVGGQWFFAERRFEQIHTL